MNAGNCLNYVRALRLPFATASALPFAAGSLINKAHFDFLLFFLGLCTAVSCHLSANLINDYADSKSGADCKDARFYGFFGGSKLIQEGVFSERRYLNLAVLFSSLSASLVIILAVLLRSVSIVGYFLAILFLAWSYSARPLQFSYRRLGEVIIFLLFGPALVMGGYFIQTKIFPSLHGFLLSLPFGFLVTAILFANEVPDLSEDKAAGKLNWVSVSGGKNAYVLYLVLVSLGFACVALNILLGYLTLFSWFSLFFIFPALKAARTLKACYSDKERLVESSKLTIALHAMVSMVLITDLLLWQR